jgi:hypothetical protein
MMYFIFFFPFSQRGEKMGENTENRQKVKNKSHFVRVENELLKVRSSHYVHGTSSAIG